MKKKRKSGQLSLNNKYSPRRQRVTREVPDLLAENLSRLADVVPSAFVEGKVDFEKLRTILGGSVDKNPDRFTFSWAGRRDAIQILQMQSRATLVPVRKESIDFDSTSNLLIEGENLEVMKLLTRAYFGTIKVIYVDPPYNKGTDRIYRDNYADPLEPYLRMTKQKDESGNLLVGNLETSGRFHSAWLSMIYPRMFLARQFLTEDGIMFVSIGQEEVQNLIQIMNEIFGEENKIGIISRLMKSGGNKGQFFSPNIDYVLVYAKNKDLAEVFRLPLEKEYIDKIYTEVETQGQRKGQRFREMGLYQAGLERRRNQRYWIRCPDGSFVIPPGKTMPAELAEGRSVFPEHGDGVWRWTYQRYDQELSSRNIVFKKTGSSSLVNSEKKKSPWNIYTKIWLNDRLEEGRVPTDLITRYENRQSSAELKELDIPFDFAKPSGLISYLISFFDDDDLTIMDFFAGSGTTAHSVLDSNKADARHRKFILIQLPEDTPPDSEARRQGYQTISDLCRVRVRKVIEKIRSGSSEKVTGGGTDLGFKFFKLSESNYKPWQGVQERTSEKYASEMQSHIDSLVEGWEIANVIYEVAIKEGFTLNSKIEAAKEFKENEVWRVTDSDSATFMLVCLDDRISPKLMKELQVSRDSTFVCRDSALDDTVAANLALQCRLKTI
ncbi:MAG: site-specific DNA-methyltransferase [Thaumarchaeota archaeon]|nr:site-specific DNA-methyltransferase [Nitrososphaerota archaeon]